MIRLENVLKISLQDALKISWRRFCKKSWRRFEVYIIDTTCFDECFLFYLITGSSIFYTNLSLPWGLVQLPCCCVLWNKYFQRSLHFVSVISTIILQWCQYQRFKTKLLLLKFSHKKMICSWCFFYTLWFCECSTFFFKNGIFKTQAPWKHVFFIKSYNQVFMTCICSHKLFKWEVISENINTTLCKYCNDYTKVTKVYEDYVEFRTDRKH